MKLNIAHVMAMSMRNSLPVIMTSNAQIPTTRIPNISMPTIRSAMVGPRMILKRQKKERPMSI
jgi:hypothetical protein